MNISKKGINLIKSYEKLELQAYPDFANIPTIGWGHTSTLSHKDLEYPRLVISKRLAEQLLKEDLIIFERCINEYVLVDISQNQFDALVSFCFNIGCEAFRKSTLLRLLNEENYESVSFQLSRWTKSTDPQTGEKVELRGLVKRRLDEAALFSSDLIQYEDNVKDVYPISVPHERERISQSRTIRAGSLGFVSTILTSLATFISSFKNFIEPISASVLYFDHFLAFFILGGMSLTCISLLYILWCRWDVFKKSKN